MSDTADPVQALIDEFLRLKWQGTPMERAVEIMDRGPPAEATRLVLAVIDAIPDAGPFLHMAFSFIPLGDWPRVVEAAISKLERSGPSASAASAIMYASLQAPASLHPHLDAVLRLASNDGVYFLEWAWRESGLLEFDRLCAIANDANRDSDDRQLAWRALLETRTPEALRFCVDVAADSRFPNRGGPLEALLQVVDHVDDSRARAFRQIVPNRVMHLTFPRDRPTLGHTQPWQSNHPTWHLASPNSVPARVGGLGEGACNHCGERLHRLIDLDPVPAGFGVTSVDRLSVCACLSCLGWENDVRTEFFQHDRETGHPTDITKTQRGAPQFPNGPLDEMSVRLVESPSRWRWQDWGASNARENLHRVGGHPCWIQDAEFPRCVSCADVMPFLMQFDSYLPSASGEFMWGSGGIAYVHWCDACRISAIHWQCT